MLKRCCNFSYFWYEDILGTTVDFIASFRCWKRTVCTEHGGTFGQCAHCFGAFFAHIPPFHNTHLYLLNGLCQYKWTHQP